MSVSETKVTKMWILLGPGVKECRSILQSDFFGNFDNSFHRHSSLDWRLCRVMPEAVWPDFEIKYFFKSCHKSNHRSVHPQRVIFRNSLKVVKNIWATFGRKFVAKNFRKMPNLVTLTTSVAFVMSQASQCQLDVTIIRMNDITSIVLWGKCDFTNAILLSLWCHICPIISVTLRSEF